MARYDCFTFFNELDLLEIRLHELCRVVDTFVLVEAPWTFQGDTKPLFFDENKRRFRRFLPQIRHIIVPNEPETNDPWQREFHQRNCIRLGLTDARLTGRPGWSSSAPS
jgi:beta-1,4-mannosyl-glycoprotein beta-1,4-N-acetylglucosaminyltransferase